MIVDFGTPRLAAACSSFRKSGSGIFKEIVVIGVGYYRLLIRAIPEFVGP
jgi:hypothetical protein